MEPFDSVVQRVDELDGIPFLVRLEKSWGDPPAPEGPTIQGAVIWRKKNPIFEDRPYAVNSVSIRAGEADLSRGLYDVSLTDGLADLRKSL